MVPKYVECLDVCVLLFIPPFLAIKKRQRCFNLYETHQNLGSILQTADVLSLQSPSVLYKKLLLVG